jgi:hypothetical protein
MKVLWLTTAFVFFSLEIFGLFVSHAQRDVMQFAQFVLAVLAFGITLIRNKIKTGYWLPGLAKARARRQALNPDLYQRDFGNRAGGESR